MSMLVRLYILFSGSSEPSSGPAFVSLSIEPVVSLYRPVVWGLSCVTFQGVRLRYSIHPSTFSLSSPCP